MFEILTIKKTSRQVASLLGTAILLAGSSTEVGLAREEIKVNLGDTRTLTGEVSGYGQSGVRKIELGARKLKYLPNLMARTSPVVGSVKAKVVEPDIYKAWLQKSHPRFNLQISKLNKNAVIVVKGQWDNSSKTLKKFGIAHRKISGSDLSRFDLRNTKVVIVDCEGHLEQIGKQKLRKFVIRGGYLLSTDWDLDGFLSSTFRNYIVWNKATNKHLIYDATVIDADPILFKNTVTNAPWKLDQESHLLRVLNPSRVRILIESNRLRREDPDQVGALAVVFPFGRGFVLHMTGHFDNNSGIPIRHRLPDPAPLIQISMRQALAANFVVAALKKEKIPFRNQ